ncbi:MAG: hypothetical protein H0W21_06250 [Actinobacteria bacterium]|nr:hypothetical protein [Actinomycetota bacterium]
MRKVIVVEWMSLDGVVQAPGAPDEDTTGDFEHGGWHLRYVDDISRTWVVQNLIQAGASFSAAGPMRASRVTGRTLLKRSR